MYCITLSKHAPKDVKPIEFVAFSYDLVVKRFDHIPPGLSIFYNIIKI